MENTFLTWQYIATFAGLVFATNLFVNFTKELPAIKSMPTKYYTSIVALVLIVLSSITSGTFNYQDIPLMMLNSIIITFTATGSYDFTNKSKVETVTEQVAKTETVETPKATTSGINILPTIDTE